MPATTFSSALIITAGFPEPTVVRRNFQLSDTPITQISTLEEFDHRFSDDYFDIIIVDREILSGPTNSTMADLQMLSQQSSSLVIADSEKFVDAPTAQHVEPENNSPRSEDSNQHLEIISQSVRCISHENRNVLQRVNMRLESLEKTLKTNELKDHDVKKLKVEFGAIHNLFETTRLICNSIQLDVELASISKIVEEVRQELLSEFGSSLAVELQMEANDQVWIDPDAIKSVISKLFQYLLGFIETPRLIRVASSVETIDDHRMYWLSFQADTKPMGKRPNDLIDLALARRIVLLHDGQLEITNANRGTTICLLGLPISAATR